MADATWVSDTHTLATATLVEATELRVVDDPAGTPASKKTSIAGIRARLIAVGNAWSAAQTLAGTTLGFSGNQNKAAWTTSGAKLLDAPGTLTDTTSSGTVADGRTNVLGGDTVAASSVTTFTDYYNAFLSQPVAGANVTLTNRWALGLFGGLKSTGQSLTGSQAQSLLDFATTWNTSGAPSALKLNVTDTASNAASLLADLQVGGSSKFSVSKAGATVINAGAVSASDALAINWASASTSILSDFGGLALYNSNITANTYSSLFFAGANASGTKVYGAAIQSQDTVKTAGATTTELLFRVRTAGTTAEIGRITGPGIWLQPNKYLVIGTQSPGIVNPGVILQSILAFAGNAHGFVDNNTINLGSGQAYAAHDVRCGLTGSNAVDHFNGFQFAPTYGNSNTCTSMRGVSSFPIINSGTITGLYHLSASPFTGAGAVTTQYGLYVEQLTNASTNWAVYTVGTTQSFFGGRVLFDAGTTAKSQLNLAAGVAPSSPVDGDIWFDGTNIKMRIGGATKTFTLI